jgi:hypothetical protein
VDLPEGEDMLPILVIAAALLLLNAPPAGAQEAEPQDTATQPAPAPQPERRAVPRGSRPQGDNPRTGTAVQRPATPSRPAPPDRGSITSRERTVVVPDRRRTIIVHRPSIFDYSYPRSYYPYGYGAFGLGYFYYDPYRWYGGYPPTGGYTTYGYSDPYRRPFSTFDIGELRLDVSLRSAQVYVDGYYAGVVDDYDGAFQALKLEPGAHRIEITAPGYESLTFDVFLNPGQKIKYQGTLRRAP